MVLRKIFFLLLGKIFFLFLSLEHSFSALDYSGQKEESFHHKTSEDLSSDNRKGVRRLKNREEKQLTVKNSAVKAPNMDNLDKKVSLDFVDANLKDVLKIFTKETGVNFVIDGQILNRPIGIFLKDVTVRQALKSIAEANGLGFYPIKGTSVLRVSEAGVGKDIRITKIYALKYANVTRLVLGSTDPEANQQNQGTEEASIFRASDAGSTQGIINAVISVLSESGILSIDKRTNSLVVTDYEDRLQRIDQIVRELDKKSRQVLIKAEIVELQDSLNKILGMTYGNPSAEKDLVSLNYSPPTVGGQVFPFNKSILGVISKQLNSLSPTARLAETVFGKLTSAQFSVILKALKTSSSSKFLARPRLVTLDNEPALVDITSDASINQQTSIDADTNQIQTTVERTRVGIRLNVTPQINSDEYVTMILQPKVTDLSPSRLFPTRVFDPSTRSVFTKIRIKQGDTISIAGLIHKTVTAVKNKIPILGEIPIIGALFSNKSREERESDLLVFITPYILNDVTIDMLQKKSAVDYEKPFLSPSQRKGKQIRLFGKKNKNPRIDSQKSLAKLELSLVSQKIKQYKNAVLQNPDEPEAHSNLGVAYAKAQKYDLAIDSFKNAIMLNPNSSTAYNNLGNLYRIKKQYDSAISTLKRAIELVPSHPYAFTTLGLCYEMKGQYDKARRSYRKALQVAPNSSWTHTSRDRLAVLDSHI